MDCVLWVCCGLVGTVDQGVVSTGVETLGPQQGEMVRV